jgi:hypothetical protein
VFLLVGVSTIWRKAWVLMKKKADTPPFQGRHGVADFFSAFLALSRPPNSQKKLSVLSVFFGGHCGPRFRGFESSQHQILPVFLALIGRFSFARSTVRQVPIL